MIKFYADKILSESINQTTGKAWIIEDVPKPWRKKVEKELQPNQ